MPRLTAYERYAREGALVLGGAAAILLQLGDPVVARGVAAHSGFARDPAGRLRRTLRYVYAVGLGDDERMRHAAAAVDGAHAGVPGARDASRQLWVAATLYWTGVRAHRAIVGPLGPGAADEIYAESARLGTVLQVPSELWPADRAAFDRYWRDAVGELVIGDDARSVARLLLHPVSAPWWMRGLMPIVRGTTAALLPPAVAAAYGLPTDRRRHRAALRRARFLVHLVPGSLRRLPSRVLLR